VRTALVSLALVVGSACSTGSTEFDRGDAIRLVERETGATSDEAECIVDGVVAKGLAAADFLVDDNSDPRFERVFDEIATQCLL
jgi:hypothetical protein